MRSSFRCSDADDLAYKALLAGVASLVPPAVQVRLLADREYSSVAMTRSCSHWGQQLCLRVNKNRWLLRADGSRKQITSHRSRRVDGSWWRRPGSQPCRSAV